MEAERTPGGLLSDDRCKQDLTVHAVTGNNIAKGTFAPVTY